MCVATWSSSLKPPRSSPSTRASLIFYLSAVDTQLKREDDQPTIGLLLCREKNRLVAEYALRRLAKPIGVPNTN